MKRILTNLLMVSLVLALAAGCGGGAKEQPAAVQPTQAPAAAQQPATQPTAKPAEPVAPAPTQAPAATDAPAPAAEEEAVLTVEDRQSGLKQFNSYRARWEMVWRTIEGDETVDFTWKWFQEYTANPEAMYVRMEGINLAGEEQPTSATEMWQIGNTTYYASSYRSDADPEARQCWSFSNEEADDNLLAQEMFDPSSLGRVEGARYVGAETINGIRTRHYKYDESAVTFLGAAKVTGDLWVAVDGGYVVKETMAWEGAGGMFGAAADAKGQGSWSWEILEVNPRLTITPPADCESAATDLPILPDATEKAQMGDMLVYKTGMKLADVAEFYQDEMVKTGWKAEDEPMITDQFGMLGFSRDGQNAQIILSPEGDKTTVTIVISK